MQLTITINPDNTDDLSAAQLILDALSGAPVAAVAPAPEPAKTTTRKKKETVSEEKPQTPEAPKVEDSGAQVPDVSTGEENPAVADDGATASAPQYTEADIEVALRNLASSDGGMAKATSILKKYGCTRRTELNAKPECWADFMADVKAELS